MTLRSCTTCGMPTQSVTVLCVDCRGQVKRAKRPEVKCSGCGRRTTSTKGICRSCMNASFPCSECGLRRAGENGLCMGCTAADRDDESPLALEEGTGYWRQRRGTKEWVPLLIEQEPKPEAVVEDPDVRKCTYGGCGVRFVVRGPDHRYCSERCRDAAARDRRIARERAETDPKLLALMDDMDNRKKAVA